MVRRSRSDLCLSNLLLTPRHLQESGSSSYSWWVPLTFTFPGNGFNKTYSKDWLKKGEKSRIVTGLPESLTPVIFNVQQTGYYRSSFLLTKNRIVTFCPQSQL